MNSTFWILFRPQTTKTNQIQVYSPPVETTEFHFPFLACLQYLKASYSHSKGLDIQMNLMVL